MLENFKYIQNIKGNEATMLVHGQIGDSIDEEGRYTYGVSGTAFAHEMLWLSNQVDVINVRFNSFGGSVLEAYSIFSAMFNCDKTVNSYIEGLAASSAGWAALGAKNCYIYDYASWMAHEPSGTDDKKALSLVKDSIAILIAGRMNKSVEDVNSMMSKETWFSNARKADFTLEQGVEMGLFDKIIDTGKKIKINKGDSLTNIALVYNKLINTTNNMEKVTNVLKLKNDASELEMVTAIEAKDTENKELKNQIETLKNELKEFKDAKEAEETKAKEALKTKATEVVNKGFEDGKIAKEEVESTIELAASSESAFSSVSNMLSKVIGSKQSQKPFDFKNVKTEKGNEDRSAWTYQDWTKNDQAGLIEMQNSAPEDFKNLLKTLKTTL